MRHPYFVFALLLAVGGTVFAAPPPPPLQFTVVSTKILYDVGEPVSGTATLTNSTKTPVQVTVRAWLEWQLDEKTKSQETKLTVEPGKTATAVFTWKKVPVQFGYAMKAEALRVGQPALTAENYFQVTDNLWKTGLISALGKYDKSRADLDNRLSQYYNVYEVFFWAPDDFLALTPKVNSWYSGQARYHGAITGDVIFPREFKSTLGLKDLLAYGHARWMRAISYAKLTGCGPTGFEATRRHPEWVWNTNGILSCTPDAETLAYWDDRNRRELPSSWLPVDYNMNDPSVVDIGIKELTDSATMFGWDGARWDGNFDVRSQTFDLAGNPVDKLTPDQVEARNADNMRRTKATISKAHPHYVYGYNYIGTTVAQNLLGQPRETSELCRGGGLLMNEYIRGAADVNHPLHTWRKFAETVVDDTQRIKQLGGYMGPIMGNYGPVDLQYAFVFAFAGGAHPYYSVDFGKFITRYSYYFWDPALVRLSLPETTLNVDGNLWWNKWVFTRDLSPKHRQLVVHLINPPTVEEVGKQKTLPPAQKNVSAMYYPFAQPGWKLRQVTRLDVNSMQPRQLPVTESLGIDTVTVPDVALWNILIFDLVKEGR